MVFMSAWNSQTLYYNKTIEVQIKRRQTYLCNSNRPHALTQLEKFPLGIASSDFGKPSLLDARRIKMNKLAKLDGGGGAFTEAEIIHAIKKLKGNRSVGPDGVPGKKTVYQEERLIGWGLLYTMGKITYLKIKARLENVEELKPNPDHSFAIKLKCSACGEISERWHDVNESDKFPGRTGRSEHHYVEKCKMCGRDNALDIVPSSIATYKSEDSEKFKSLISFEGRGLEVVDYQPSDNWSVKVDGSNKVFSDVDLSEKEWVEYDEKIQESVGVYDLEHLIE